MEDGSEIQMMSMSMKSGGSESTSGSRSLVGLTVDLGVGVGWDEVAERVLIFGGLLIVIGWVLGTLMEGNTPWEWEASRKSRVGSYPLNPFDAVLLDQYVFTLFYC